MKIKANFLHISCVGRKTESFRFYLLMRISPSSLLNTVPVVVHGTYLGPSSASILKSLACRMQWGRAAAGMEPVGALPGSKCDNVKV